MVNLNCLKTLHNRTVCVLGAVLTYMLFSSLLGEVAFAAGLQAGYNGGCTNCVRNGQVSRNRLPLRQRSNQRNRRARTQNARGGYRGKPMAAACSSIIDANQNVGPIGQQLHRAMLSPEYRNRYVANGSLNAFCPKFNNLSPEQRIKAWIHFWAVLANAESTCNPSVLHRTRDNRGRVLNPRLGTGLFALEYDPDVRYWRGPKCRGNMGPVAKQVACAVDIMHDLQLQSGRGIHGVSDRMIYWGPARRFTHERRNGRRVAIPRATEQIIPNMTKFPGCF